MKTKFLLLVASTVIAANLVAEDKVAVPNYKKDLSSVTVLEMPAKAAGLVAQAPAKDRAVVTSAVVKSVAAIKVTALPATVGAIAKSSPDMAATAAAVATSVEPKLAVDVSKAAAASAPTKAGEIVAAVCKVLPENFRNVAAIVAKIAPDQAKQILAGVGTAIPRLAPFINQAGVGATGALDVAAILAHAESLAASSTTTAATTSGNTLTPRPPSVGSPYNPLPTGTPTTGSVTNSGTVPGGGRDYTPP
ncbi:MAG: hypothetical protein RLY20_1203 [Verrucomicrobiota bacterium]|jgi:hypothetical protein